MAYSSLIENLEEMAGVEGEAVVEGGEKEENQCEGDEKKEEEEENGKSQPQIEVKSGKSSPGEEINEDFAAEERWKENKEGEEEEGKPSLVQNNTLQTDSHDLKEKDASDNNNQLEENWKETASLCLDEAEKKLKQDQEEEEERRQTFGVE